MKAGVVKDGTVYIQEPCTLRKRISLKGTYIQEAYILKGIYTQEGYSFAGYIHAKSLYLQKVCTCWKRMPSKCTYTREAYSLERSTQEATFGVQRSPLSREGAKIEGAKSEVSEESQKGWS